MSHGAGPADKCKGQEINPQRSVPLWPVSTLASCVARQEARICPVKLRTSARSVSLDGSRADPTAICVHVDVAAAHDGDDVSASEAVPVFENRRNAKRG